jgi:hypothetical protein
LAEENPAAPAVKREAEEDWARSDGRACGAENNARDFRFPPPWSVDEATESFCIRDANGQALTQGTR